MADRNRGFSEVPDGITREHVLAVMAEVGSGEMAAFEDSTSYDVLYEGKRFPPKALIGLAARNVIGRPLKPAEFHGGEGTRAFSVLKSLGFTIVPKLTKVDELRVHTVWLEMTKSEHLHGGKGWEFGTCLWSPSEKKGGGDSYAAMRDLVQGDLVIHCEDSKLAGFSYVTESYKEIKKAPPNPGIWAGRPGYYRVDVKDFSRFERSTSLSDFVVASKGAITRDLKDNKPFRYPFFVTGGGDVRTVQGAYVTRVSPVLYELIRKSVNDPRLPALAVESPTAVTQRREQSPSYANRGLGDSMEALLAHTLLERPLLEEIVAAVTQASPQIVLAGPPGTSKTWIAEGIARHISGGESKVRLVQFHPNYSYEAFVEGLRPVAEGGGINFKLQRGALLDLVKDMQEAKEIGNDDSLYVMVIDEMNRANLPRVFGELMYLFEYRDRKIRLQYSEGFSLPSNLRFIGTMNTADRSIRSIDIALRRRFDVFELKPDSGVLGRYFRKHSLNVPNLIEGFEQLNNQLNEALDRHHTIGHAFFMMPGINRSMLQAVWRRKIYPLIEEYFFDQPDIAREYTFEKFWS